MRGLNRTSVLKFDHPGLDTAATRDGERLLIQPWQVRDEEVLVDPSRDGGKVMQPRRVQPGRCDLLAQVWENDIGTNDAHVLVIQVAAHSITLTYSDLHRVGLEFFQGRPQI